MREGLYFCDLCNFFRLWFTFLPLFHNYCGVAVRIKYSFMDLTVLNVSSHNHKWGTWSLSHPKLLGLKDKEEELELYSILLRIKKSSI